MRQTATFTLALALGVAAAFALVSCGGEDAKLLPGGTAREITENLDAVKQLADEGECAGAAGAAEEVSAQVDALEGVDAKLKQSLDRGAERLNEVIVTCEEATTEAIAPPTEETETETEETEPPGQEKKEEKEREKEEKEQEKEEQEAEEETPEPPTTTVPPSEDGGTDAPGGVSPATPAEPEDEDD